MVVMAKLNRLNACCASGVCGAPAAKAAQKDRAAEDQVQVITTCGPGLANLLQQPLAQTLAQTFFGPESVQEELSGRTAHMVEQAVMEGRSGAVLCCGAGGLGKRRGLLGTQAAASGERPGSLAGRVERALFDHMEAKCTLGDVFIVDVSCLQIGFHPEDRREQLRDLQLGPGLKGPPAGLRLLPDPLRPGLFAVDGLRRVPVLTRGDLGAALDGALGRCSGEDCHVVVTINIDRIGIDSSSSILTQIRTRLMLVDVAACDEHLRTASAAGSRGLQALRAALRPARPLKAVRSLSARRQDSTVNLLLDSCVGLSATPALLLVHLDPGAQGGAGALAFAERVALPSDQAAAGPPRAKRAAPPAGPSPSPGARFRSQRYGAAAARAAATVCPEGERPESARWRPPGATARPVVGCAVRVLSSGRVGEVIVHDPADTSFAYKVKFGDGSAPGVDWYPAAAVACA